MDGVPLGMTRDQADDWFDDHYGGDLVHDDPEFYDLFIDHLTKCSACQGSKIDKTRTRKIDQDGSTWADCRPCSGSGRYVEASNGTT